MVFFLQSKLSENMQTAICILYVQYNGTYNQTLCFARHQAMVRKVMIKYMYRRFHEHRKDTKVKPKIESV